MSVEIFIVIVVAALIGFRVGRAVAMDDVGEPVRRAARNFAASDPQDWKRRWPVGLTKCGHCIGFWLTLGISFLISAVLLDVDWTVDVIIALAATGLQSLFTTYAQEEQVALEFKPPDSETPSEEGKSDTTPPEFQFGDVPPE